MTKQVTLQIEDELFDRAMTLAAKRGISLNQLLNQQLERTVSNDEYTMLQKKVAQQRQVLNQPRYQRSEPRRAPRRG